MERIAHCLFEQSGTFKNEFIKLGIPSYDYDICNDYGQTDYQIDLFKEIENAYRGGVTIFDKISLNDVVIAFFPCTLFQENNVLWFTGKVYQQANYTDMQKLEVAYERHKELCYMYERFTELCMVAIARGIKLIIENPYTQPHYLTRYFPIEPTLIDMDRRTRGDWLRKPTQYWFINCKPQNNMLFEPEIIQEYGIVNKIKGSNRQRKRSEIKPEYANRFIREFIWETR